MRLLNAKTLDFKCFDDPQSVKYAILSYVWSDNGEQSYKDFCAVLQRIPRPQCDIRRPQCDIRQHPSIPAKIRHLCARALADGYTYVWIDACCIDKSNSAEQSEAINSMYRWYAAAARCYVFLHDVAQDDNPRALGSQFRRSVWFTRGWTLQELIAPSVLVFLGREWRPIGTKQSLAWVVEEVTGIDVDILKGTRSVRDVSVSRRMSWAAQRRTRREEDAAYCLLGLFGIHMVPTYGEKGYAFVRLQEAILQHVPDDTLFAWGERLFLTSSSDVEALECPRDPSAGAKKLFASAPSNFGMTADLRPISHRTLMQRLGLLDSLEADLSYPPPAYSATRFGFKVELPILELAFQQREGRRSSLYRLTEVKVGFLLCEDAERRLIALILRPPSFQSQTWNQRDGTSTALRVGACTQEWSADGEWVDYRLVTLTEEMLGDLLQTHRLSVSAVHILIRSASGRTSSARRPNSETASTLSRRSIQQRRLSSVPPPSPCDIRLSEWCKLDLAEKGIAVREVLVDPPSEYLPEYYRRVVFTFSSKTRAGSIGIVFGHCEHCGLRRSSSLGRDLRVRVQSSTLPDVSWDQLPGFEPHHRSEEDYNHLHFWPSWDGVSYMEYTLRGSDPGTAQVVRLAVSLGDPLRGSAAFEVYVKLTERRVRARTLPDRLEASSKQRQQ